MVGIPGPDGSVLAAGETVYEHPSWPAARRDALQLTCLAGTRYVSVQRPDGVVAGEYDRYTNRWRQYRRALADVEHIPGVSDARGGGSAVVAWCSCGWSKLAFYPWHAPGAKETATVKEQDMARAHEADPTVS